MIFPLADAQNVRKSGAKATYLAELVSAGFAIPRGFVLSADAYRAHLWACGQRQSATVSADAEVREAVRASMLAGEIPEDILSPIAEAYKRISWQTGLAEPKVAVRPSALDDAGFGGFPGAYESYLNVAGLDDLYVAIKRVWASLWSGKAAMYRSRFESLTDPAMAVIIQLMIPATATGTSFTANPVTGDPSVAQIIAKSAQDGSAHYAVDLRSMSVGRTTGDDLLAVSEDTLRQVAEQSILAEDALRSPVTVEWAAQREGVWILQANPIRDLPAYFPVDADYTQNTRWKKMDAEPLSYFARSISAGPAPSKKTTSVRIAINGYLYARDEPAQASNDRNRSKEIDAAAATLREWEKKIYPDLTARIGEHIACKLTDLTDSELAGILQAAASVARSAYDWMCRTQHPSVAPPDMLAELLNDRPLAWRLLGGGDDLILQRDAYLQELAERFVIAENAGRVDDESWWKPYKHDVDQFVCDYTYAFTDNVDASDPARWSSWIEDRDAVFWIISAISRRGDSPTLVTLNCAAEQEAAFAEAAAMGAIAKNLHADFTRLLGLCRKWKLGRSQIEQSCARAGASIRLIVGEYARRLMADKTISCADDLYYVSVDELSSLKAADHPKLANRIAHRKHENWLERRLLAPDILPADEQPQTFGVDSADPSLYGIAAGEGIVTGRARVVTTLSEASEIEPGDILVIPCHGAAWTPFMALAGGFVCGSGHDMRAEAVAARVYGIPAGVGCEGIECIRDGQKIAVDGSMGLVSAQDWRIKNQHNYFSKDLDASS